MLLPHDNQPSIIHRTVAHQAETENINPKAEIWEFRCPDCDYRASYTRRSSRLISELTVWNLGDAKVRHHNSFASEEKEESWLTFDLRQQMEYLLQDVNLDH
jgi:hypothetical protein